ncbi:MAG: hypothetical protein JNM67_06960 [Bacteroidetes bacterium]|nr:hypothetical protein [Bacteroidota bacterium]
MKKLFILATVLASAYSAKAQVKISKPAGLEGLIASRTSQKKHPNAETKGYHILIFNGDSRSKAEAMKARFDAEYPGYFSEVVWDEPNFKVYVGLFVSKFECLKLYEEIKGKFQTTIIVSAKIAYQKLD